MSVYFIHSPALGGYKVGFSRKPYGRFRELQSHNGDTLTLVEAWDGDLRRERSIHASLAHVGARIRGEWFEATAVEDFVRVTREVWIEQGLGDPNILL